MFFFRKIITNTCRESSRRLYSNQKGDVTSLYDFHVQNGGKIVNFGGFLLPVQYSDQSIVNSHLFTRKSASIFDVSHMLQTEIRGKYCIDFMETLCTADIRELSENSASLTVFTNQKGGILDDLIVTKVNDEYLFIVSNAAMKTQDQEIMVKGLRNYQKTFNSNAEIEIKFYEPLERALIALQGPKAATSLQKLTEVDLSVLYFMTTTTGSVADVQRCRITRCGYTGEDGFELSIPAENAEKLVKALLENTDVKLAGLGARDSLRLEAGLCLYGSDINSDTTPVEGALSWLVSKRRREQQNFPGAAEILRQIKEGSKIKRIGLISTSGPPPRHGAKILSIEGKELGHVTSGCPSPSLGQNVAMGYISTEYSKVGTKLVLKIRDRVYDGIVTKMPFVPANYYNKPKAK